MNGMDRCYWWWITKILHSPRLFLYTLQFERLVWVIQKYSGIPEIGWIDSRLTLHHNDGENSLGRCVWFRIQHRWFSRGFFCSAITAAWFLEAEEEEETRPNKLFHRLISRASKGFMRTAFFLSAAPTTHNDILGAIDRCRAYGWYDTTTSNRRLGARVFLYPTFLRTMDDIRSYRMCGPSIFCMHRNVKPTWIVSVQDETNASGVLVWKTKSERSSSILLLQNRRSTRLDRFPLRDIRFPPSLGCWRFFPYLNHSLERAVAATS